MRHIFVNLKRFEVSKQMGGLCPLEDPIIWIESVIDQSVEIGLGHIPDIHLTYLLPEGLVPSAVHRLNSFTLERIKHLEIGCQGVHWEDIAPGKNFGAFTFSQPATAVRHLGATWAIIGHSEERKVWLQAMAFFEPGIASSEGLRQTAARAVDKLINGEVLAGLHAGLNVLVCIGETGEERGEGSFEAQQPRIEQVLSAQVTAALLGMQQALGERELVIGYEPIWAIGPGKVPPGKDYIAYVSALIQKVAIRECGLNVTVVYGGGLKEENAAMIAGIPTVGGGLVGLTRFSGEIGFEVNGLAKIIEKYQSI